MSSRKRIRDIDSSQDIRILFQHANESIALRRSGPFFLERILSPRLLTYHCGINSMLHDPTRVQNKIIINNKNNNVIKNKQKIGVLALPQRTEASARREYYSNDITSNDFKTIVSGSTMDLTNIIHDIVFDMQEEFALVCHRGYLAIYNTEEWIEIDRCKNILSENSSPVVLLEARGWRRMGFAFSSVQFIASSLHIIASYHHAPAVDIFDLEVVDEATSTPQQRFSLTGNQVINSNHNNNNSSNDGIESVYANDVIPVSEYISLAALSSGRSVWLDRRSGKVTTCTGAFSREYNIGGFNNNNNNRNLNLNDVGPLTSAAFLCRDNPVNVMCGTERGALQLWDVRFPKNYISIYHTSSAICRIQPSYSGPLEGIVWINNEAGEVQGLRVDNTEMQLLAQVKCNDTERSIENFDVKRPRLAVMNPAGIIITPQVSKNALLMFDGSGGIIKNVHKRNSSSSSFLSKSNDGGSGLTINDEYNNNNNNDEILKFTNSRNMNYISDDDNNQSDNNNYYYNNVYGNVSSTSLLSHSHSNNNNNKTSQKKSKVHSIPLKNVWEFTGCPNISACGVWSKQGRILVGDRTGCVKLA